jgi:hypothetical protein
MADDAHPEESRNPSTSQTVIRLPATMANVAHPEESRDPGTSQTDMSWLMWLSKGTLTP